MNEVMLFALCIFLVVIFLGAMFCVIISSAFPPENKNKPRGGGWVE